MGRCWTGPVRLRILYGIGYGVAGDLRMNYAVNLEACEGGEYLASCPELGLTVRGLGAGNALDALRDEIRYRVELCPCTTVDDDFVQLNVST